MHKKLHTFRFLYLINHAASTQKIICCVVLQATLKKKQKSPRKIALVKIIYIPTNHTFIICSVKSRDHTYGVIFMRDW